MKFTIAKSTNWLLKKIPNSNYWEVASTFEWYINYKSKNEVVFVRHWFKTNFWSIPRPLWFVFNKTKYISYILHDYLYSKEWKIEDLRYFEKSFDIPYTRKEADLILLESLHVENCGFLERTLIYLWVRIFWGLFYKKK